MRKLAIFSCLMAAVPLLSQTPTGQKPSFEVVSVKPNNSRSYSGGTTTTDHSVSARNVTLKSLIQSAYRVQSFQITGGPDWMNSDKFDVEAKMEPQVIEDRGPKDPSRGEPNRIALMMQSMLEDRFGLKIHRATRELPVYALIVGKDGAKLKAAGGLDHTGVTTNGSRNKVEIRATAIPLARLATALGNELDRPVVDSTKLNGVYDVVLSWSPQTTAALIAAGREDTPPTAETGPSIFTAIQEQLGLKLESSKGPVEVIVIDSVQKPSEN